MGVGPEGLPWAVAPSLARGYPEVVEGSGLSTCSCSPPVSKRQALGGGAFTLWGLEDRFN